MATVKVEEELAELAERAAVANGETVEDVIERALRAYLEPEREARS